MGLFYGMNELKTVRLRGRTWGLGGIGQGTGRGEEPAQIQHHLLLLFVLTTGGFVTYIYIDITFLTV